MNYKYIARAAAVFLAVSAAAVSASCTKDAGKYQSEFTSPDYTVNALPFDEMGAYEGAVNSGGNSNQGALENGVIISPYLECKVNGTAVKTYATRCTTGAHSFAYIDVTGENVGLDVELNLAKTRKKVVVLPESRGVNAEMEDEKTVKARIERTGSYSFAFDDKEDRAFTLIVKKAEQFSVPEGYSVKYFEPETYTAEQTSFTEENVVYYFKSGTYVLDGISLPSNSVLYSDYAYFNVSKTTKTHVLKSENTSNVRVCGRSLFDFSGIDQTTDGKGTFGFTNVKNFVFEGVTSIGSCGWTFNFNRCENGEISNITGLAYRTWTDGIMIANSHDMKVSDSFMRTGDDAFEVKSTGAGESYNIEYSDCHAWNDKAVAFGVIYEMNYTVRNVSFKDCSVGFNMPVWDVTRAAASVCMCDYEKGLTNHDISFENFEIYYSQCPAISLCLHSGTLDNISFKNFTVKKNYVDNSVYIKFNASYLSGEKPTEKRICRIRKVTFDDILIEGERLKEKQIFGADLPDALYIDGAKYGGKSKEN